MADDVESQLAAVDAEAPSAGAGTSTVAVARRPQTRLEPHQFDFVAQALENAVPVEEIARALRVEPGYIKALAQGRNDSFNRVRDGYRQEILNHTVAWKFRLGKMLDLSYAAIQNALQQTKDPKLAAEQAWAVLHAVIPQSRPTTSTGPAVQMNFGANAQVQTQLADTLTNVLGSFQSLKATMVNGLGSPDVHLKEGADAIVQLGIPDRLSDAPLSPASFNGNGSGSTESTSDAGGAEPGADGSA